MNRDQKAAAIAEIADQIQEADAVFAVDYRGISVPQAAELRTRLRDSDASFRVVKNTLTERAADQAGAEALKGLLEGPTALAFVRGDAAMAAKAIADYARATELLPFKGGVMNGDTLEPAQISAIARLPARDVLYGHLVGVVASPISGVVRTLNALIAGLASQLGQIADKKESGDIPAGEAPAAPAAEPAEHAPAEAGTEPTDGDAEEAPRAEAEEPPGDAARDAESPTADPDPPAEAEAPADAEAAPATDTEGDQDAGHDPQPVQPDQAEGESEDAPAEASDQGG